MTTTFFDTLPTQLGDLQRKYLVAREENLALRLYIAQLETQTAMLEIELRKLRAAIASPINERTT